MENVTICNLSLIIQLIKNALIFTSISLRNNTISHVVNKT